MFDKLPFALFAKPVSMTSERSVNEALLVLGSLTRAPFQWRRKEAIFVGRVERSGSRLWFSRKSALAYPARSLNFHLVETIAGCELIGELTVIAPLRFFVLAYLLFAVVGGPWMSIECLLHGGSIWLALGYLLRASALGVIFVYGYSGLAVWFGRRAEAQGLKVLRYILAGDSSTAVVLDLLSSSR